MVNETKESTLPAYISILKRLQQEAEQELEKSKKDEQASPQ